jgi:hypothetical protein
VYEVTGGNPLLVTEVLAAADQGVPATVRDLVLSRLAALSPAARDVAGLVSVVPSYAEPALLGSRARGHRHQGLRDIDRYLAERLT